MKKLKTAKTTKEYKTKYNSYDLVVPVGSKVSNKTAGGYDDSYRFWTGWNKQIAALTGYKNSILAHDLTHYGLNIPAEYCETYPD